ncbi:outer membrane beta-barrel family protein [Anditalea andensis]|uniref:outer membrane beta-barrel family protein n=1 Tax=Anditalea andensis TaxID=1048983 RepID=UPI0013DEC7A9|nr:outer membrane beta-barrel family protein [Anditalea andensis]
MPGVIVSTDDDIRIGAKSGARVMIGNRLLRLSGEELRNYLQALRAEDISSIEVIARPPASFDAEGSGGIIKINMRRNTNSGYNGTVSTNFSHGRYSRFSGAATSSVRTEKLEAQASLNIPHSVNYRQTDIGRSQWNSSERFESSSFYRSGNAAFNYRMGLNFYPGKNHTLGLEASGSFLNEKVKAMSADGTFASSGTVDSIMRYSNFPDTREKGLFDLGLNYRWDVDSAGGALELLGNHYSSKSERTTYYSSNFYDTQGSMLRSILRYSDLGTNMDISTIQGDFSKNIVQFVTLRTGAKFSRVGTRGDNCYKNFDGEGEWQPDSILSNGLSYSEKVYAGYASATLTMASTEIQAGLRVERTDMKTRSLGDNQEFGNLYTNFFPSVFLKQEITERQYISVNYTRRILRPPYQALNPYRILVNENTMSEGNPYLRPQLSHNFAFSYSPDPDFEITLSYDSQTDVFGDTELGSSLKTIVTTGNIAEAKDATLDIFWSKDFTQWWTSMNNLSGTYNRFRNDYFDRHAKFLFATTNNTFSVSPVFTFQFNGRLFTKGVDRYYTILMNSWVFDVGTMVRLMDRRLVMTMGVNDIFHRDGNRRLSMDNGTFQSITHSKWDTRRAYIGLTWQFRNDYRAVRGIKRSNQEEVNRTWN